MEEEIQLLQSQIAELTRRLSAQEKQFADYKQEISKTNFSDYQTFVKRVQFNTNIGFYKKFPIIQWNSGIGRQDVTSNTGSAMNVGCLFDGNTGLTYYSVGDIVAALKAYGLLAA